jgi:hypothetical protein
MDARTSCPEAGKRPYVDINALKHERVVLRQEVYVLLQMNEWQAQMSMRVRVTKKCCD